MWRTRSAFVSTLHSRCDVWSFIVQSFRFDATWRTGSITSFIFHACLAFQPPLKGKGHGSGFVGSWVGSRGGLGRVMGGHKLSDNYMMLIIVPLFL